MLLLLKMSKLLQFPNQSHQNSWEEGPEDKRQEYAEEEGDEDKKKRNISRQKKKLPND